MFERFTDRARQVIVLAQEEAFHLKHDYIGTEHILLGLAREPEGLGARVLESLDVPVERIRAQVVKVGGKGEERTTGQIPFTPRAKKVLAQGMQEADALDDGLIATHHLLLGLLRETEGVANRVLLDLGADAEHLRGLVLTGLDTAPDEHASAETVTRVSRHGDPAKATTAGPAGNSTAAVCSFCGQRGGHMFGNWPGGANDVFICDDCLAFLHDISREREKGSPEGPATDAR